jgi:hypothetical protein
MEEEMHSISRASAIAAAIAISLAATAARADDDDIIRWKNIVGVITEKNVSNMVGNIDSGTFAWSVRSGHARVDLMTGHAAFEVEGLSINGAQFSGTPGPITDVMGTLVCNAVDANPEHTRHVNDREHRKRAPECARRRRIFWQDQQRTPEHPVSKAANC